MLITLYYYYQGELWGTGNGKTSPHLPHGYVLSSNGRCFLLSLLPSQSLLLSTFSEFIIPNPYGSASSFLCSSRETLSSDMSICACNILQLQSVDNPGVAVPTHSFLTLTGHRESDTPSLPTKYKGIEMWIQWQWVKIL